MKTIAEAWAYAEFLAHKVLAEQRLTPYRVELRSRKQSGGGTNGDGYIVIISTGSLQRCLDGAWTEYATVARNLNIPSVYSGRAGVHHLVLHECAHALQMQRRLSGRGDRHGPGFQRCLHELMQAYPSTPTIVSAVAPRDRAYVAARHSPGDVITWKWKGQDHTSTIVRLNPTAMVVNDLGTGGEWKLPYQMYDAVGVQAFDAGIDIDDLMAD